MAQTEKKYNIRHRNHPLAYFKSSKQVRTILFDKSDVDASESQKWKVGSTQERPALGPARVDLDNAFKSHCATPPMEKRQVSTPRAPKKPKRRIGEVDLKPKQLVYMEEELRMSGVDVDSGVFSSSGIFIPRDEQGCKNEEKENDRGTRASLVVNFQKMRLRSSNKENEQGVARKELAAARSNSGGEKTAISAADTDGKCKYKTGPKESNYKGFDPKVMKLSQFSDDLDWQNKLRWLQPRRDVGMWIECCNKNCKKWRYVEDYHDPLDVPEMWFCHMNSGLFAYLLIQTLPSILYFILELYGNLDVSIDKTLASCKIPETPKPLEIEEDLIENRYNAGSIVWAHVVNFPWWPAIVDDCPTTFTYYQLRKSSIKPFKYHVTFFDDKELRHTWVTCKNIKPFVKHEYKTLVKQTVFHGIDYKAHLDKACVLANIAIPLSILERLEKFSFLAQYGKEKTIFCPPDIHNIHNGMIRTSSQASRVLSCVSTTTEPESADEIMNTQYSTRHTSLRSYYDRLRVARNRPTE